MDRKKIMRSLGIILGITLFVAVGTRLAKKSNYTLADYANDYPERNVKIEKTVSKGDEDAETNKSDSKNIQPKEITKKEDKTEEKKENEMTDDLTEETKDELTREKLIGETLMHLTPDDGDFFAKDISDDLRKYITGTSFPTEEQNDISISDLDYVHIKYIDFEGTPQNGELICNKYISEDLIYIFKTLYENDYRIEKVRLIDEYDGDDELSMADDNSSCFNYRCIAGTKTLSKHSLGLAIDINPLYNPYITYNDDGSENISPAEGSDYTDRSGSFPYKIDEEDLCYKLFTERGFTWGGNWNSSKDYQHFQKTKP